MQPKTAHGMGIRFLAVGATTLALGVGGGLGPALALDIPIRVPGVVDARVSTTNNTIVDVDVPAVGASVGIDLGSRGGAGSPLPDVDVGLPDVDVLSNNGGSTGGGVGAGGGVGGGTSGSNGTNGSNGRDGSNGSNGSSGPSGSNGSSGPGGSNGSSGSNGSNGDRGTDGSNGRDGAAGGVVVIGGGTSGGTPAGRGAEAGGSANTSANSSANGAANGAADGSGGGSAGTGTDGTGSGDTSSLSTDGDRLTAGSTGHGLTFWLFWLLLAAVAGGALAWGAGRYRRYRKDRALRRRMSILAREMREAELVPAGGPGDTR